MFCFVSFEFLKPAVQGQVKLTKQDQDPCGKSSLGLLLHLSSWLGFALCGRCGPKGRKCKVKDRELQGPLGLDLGTYRMRTERKLQFRAVAHNQDSHPAGTGWEEPHAEPCRDTSHTHSSETSKLQGLSSCPGVSCRLGVLLLPRAGPLPSADLVHCIPSRNSSPEGLCRSWFQLGFPLQTVAIASASSELEAERV